MLQLPFVLQHLQVLCKCMENVQIHTKVLVRPPANTHAEAGKRRCSAGWQAGGRGKDSYSLLLDPVRTHRQQNIKAQLGGGEGAVCRIQFCTSSEQHTPSSKHSVIIWEFSLWAVGSFIPHCKLWSYMPVPFLYLYWSACKTVDFLLYTFLNRAQLGTFHRLLNQHQPKSHISITWTAHAPTTVYSCLIIRQMKPLAGLCKVQEQNRAVEWVALQPLSTEEHSTGNTAVA